MNKNKKNNQSEKKGRTSRVYIGYGMFGGTQIPKIYEFSKFNGEICMKNRNLWVTVRKFPESNRLYSHYNPEGKEYYLLVKHRCTPNSLVLSSLYLRMAFSSPKHSTTGEPSQNLWKLFDDHQVKVILYNPRQYIIKAPITLLLILAQDIVPLDDPMSNGTGFDECRNIWERYYSFIMQKHPIDKKLEKYNIRISPQLWVPHKRMKALPEIIRKHADGTCPNPELMRFIEEFWEVENTYNPKATNICYIKEMGDGDVIRMDPVYLSPKARELYDAWEQWRSEDPEHRYMTEVGGGGGHIHFEDPVWEDEMMAWEREPNFISEKVIPRFKPVDVPYFNRLDLHKADILPLMKTISVTETFSRDPSMSTFYNGFYNWPWVVYNSPSPILFQVGTGEMTPPLEDQYILLIDRKKDRLDITTFVFYCAGKTDQVEAAFIEAKTDAVTMDFKMIASLFARQLVEDSALLEKYLEQLLWFRVFDLTAARPEERSESDQASEPPKYLRRLLVTGTLKYFVHGFNIQLFQDSPEFYHHLINYYHYNKFHREFYPTSPKMIETLKEYKTGELEVPLHPIKFLLLLGRLKKEDPEKLKCLGFIRNQERKMRNNYEIFRDDYRFIETDEGEGPFPKK